MKRFVFLLAFLAGLGSVVAQTPDDQYVYLYNAIQEADALERQGQIDSALLKYREIHASLSAFQKGYPDWNPPIVKFRLNFLNAKIAALAPRATSQVAKPGPSPRAGGEAATRAQPLDAAAAQQQLEALQEQVRQLQADKTVLEAKLREALAVQPAAVDPRELARAQQRIRLLEKQTDLLQAGLEQARAQARLDPAALTQAQSALAEANRKLAEETRRANTLAEEKKQLQAKLESLIPSGWNLANIEKTKQALEDAHRQLAEQQEIARKLRAEKEALELRAGAPVADASAASALRAENELLKKQLESLKASSSGSARTRDLRAQLAQAQALVATLQSEKEILRLEKVALQERVKALSGSSTPAVAAVPAPFTANENQRLRDLERERDDLRKKLEAATKAPRGQQSNALAARVKELEQELATLRLRVEVFEAQKAPYAPEELALFKQASTTVTLLSANRSDAPSRPLSSSEAALAREAQRQAAAGQFDKAEESYRQILRQNPNQVGVLANLAVVQVERGQLEEADKTLRQALTLAPDDARVLSTLGLLRFRQRRYDEALDALGRAAKLEPQNAQIQMRLGLVLSEKGLRGPAEAALRKAIQLEPGYGEAHNNLAVVYLTQDPPLVELARWHYRRALSSGAPRNPELEKLIESKEKKSTGP